MRIFNRTLVIHTLALTALCLSVNVSAAKDEVLLTEIVMERDDEQRARDTQRRPVETLSFFDVKPGMSVAEALPGGGWYSRILSPYLGNKGALYGINYNDDMWGLFGFFSEERIAQLTARTNEFPGMITEFTDNGITTAGFTFATAPDDIKGTVDRVLYIRALHNLNRFEPQAGTMTEALSLTHDLLKEDGMVGVVQHRAPEGNTDEWADGSSGYLKQSTVISAFEAAGFELVASSEINANDKDKPTEEDFVWRLPPSLNGSAEDPEKRAAMQVIGESDRMTLLFRKASK
ncbi:MAG: methyltransferase [Pseudomonadota bacterium]